MRCRALASRCQINVYCFSILPPQLYAIKYVWVGYFLQYRVCPRSSIMPPKLIYYVLLSLHRQKLLPRTSSSYDHHTNDGLFKSPKISDKSQSRSPFLFHWDLGECLGKTVPGRFRCGRRRAWELYIYKSYFCVVKFTLSPSHAIRALEDCQSKTSSRVEKLHQFRLYFLLF